MSLDAQRIIDVIRQAIGQMTNNGARRDYASGYTTTGGAYQVTAYINASDAVSPYINVPAGLYIPVGSYVETVRIEDDVQVVRSMPTLFSRLAFDWINGRVYTGTGSAEVNDPGTSGYVLKSGGAAGSAYWGSVSAGSSVIPYASTPAAVSTAGATGSSADYARGDHVHAHEAAHSAHDTIWDAKGDILTGSGADTAVKTTVGADDTILMADAAAAGGVKWVASASPSAVGTAAVTGTADTFTRGDHVHAHEAAHINHDTTWSAKGDLIVGTANDTAQVLTVGANDTIPMADSGQTTGIKWVASATPGTAAFGDSPATGTADTFSRGDHVHGMPADPATDVKTFGLVVPSDDSFTANTFADLTGMTFSVVAGKSYVIQLFLVFAAAGTSTGIVIGFNHPGGTARAYAEYHGQATAASHVDEWVNGGVDSGTGIASVNASGTFYGIEYSIWYQCDTNGTFAVRRRRAGSSATVAVYAGSGGTVSTH